MAEHKLEGRVLGLTLDGTGYGTDGRIWGGEILAADEAGFERLGHLAYVPMPGGTAAIKEPWRMAVSYLRATFGEAYFTEKAPLLRWGRERIDLLLQMLRRQVNSPLTSSCGRLFDGVAALVGLRDRIAYEGQAAIELEQCMEPTEERYRYEFNEADGVLLLSPTAIFAQVAEDVVAGARPGVVSGKFHQTLVQMFAEACRHLATRHGLTRVVCSGGVFQNLCILTNLERRLRELGLEVYTHELVPSNDGCIALGQALVGAASLGR
jgi:hydrogenase maturation protein HypF